MIATDQIQPPDTVEQVETLEVRQKENRHHKRFFWGSLLTLVTLLPWAVNFAFAMFSIMLHRPNRGAFPSDPHLMKIYMTLRLIIAIIAAAAALTFLVRSFRTGHPVRAVASGFAILWNIYMVFISVFFLRMLYVRW